VPEKLRWQSLYDLVGTAMWAYTSAAFRVRFVGNRDWRIRRGEMLVSTHRAETDVPLICGQVFVPGRVCLSRTTRLNFAAREDMFERGFFAGFPPGLSPRVRRLLYPLNAGPFLPRVGVRPLPFPGADLLRLGRALEAVDARTPLADVIPGELVSRLEERARDVRRPRPVVAGDVLRGEYADILWESRPREVLSAPLLEPVWRRRLDRATEEIRGVIDVIREGQPILFFPEGRPSPDGTIGPLRPGLKLLVRRARPQTICPVGIAYDRITTGRHLAYFGIGHSVEPPADEIEQALLDLLRRTTPLTCGQVVATALRSAAEEGSGSLATPELDARLRSALEEARSEGRPFDERLLEPGRRHRRLADALEWVLARDLASCPDRRTLVLDRDAVLADPELAYAVREHGSARESAR